MRDSDPTFRDEGSNRAVDEPRFPTDPAGNQYGVPGSPYNAAGDSSGSFNAPYGTAGDSSGSFNAPYGTTGDSYGVNEDPYIGVSPSVANPNENTTTSARVLEFFKKYWMLVSAIVLGVALAFTDSFYLLKPVAMPVLAVSFSATRMRYFNTTKAANFNLDGTKFALLWGAVCSGVELVLWLLVGVNLTLAVAGGLLFACETAHSSALSLFRTGRVNVAQRFWAVVVGSAIAISMFFGGWFTLYILGIGPSLMELELPVIGLGVAALVVSMFNTVRRINFIHLAERSRSSVV